MVYNKVKSGCRTCKQRKVKCDETKPSCRRCVKAGWPCPFARITLQEDNFCAEPIVTPNSVQTRLSRPNDYVAFSTVSLPSVPCNTEPPELRRLLSHFTSCVAPGLRMCRKQTLWTTTLPLASTVSPLMQQALVAFASSDLFSKTGLVKHAIQVYQAKSILLAALQRAPDMDPFTTWILTLCLLITDAAMGDHWRPYLSQIVRFSESIDMTSWLRFGSDCNASSANDSQSRLTFDRCSTLAQLCSQIDIIDNAEDADSLQDMLLMWYGLTRLDRPEYFRGILKLAARWQQGKWSTIQRIHFQEYDKLVRTEAAREKSTALEPIQQKW